MKSLLIIMGLPLVLAACHNQSKRVQDFIPGTYVNAAKGEYGVANDTLVITAGGELHYHLVWRTGYRALRDGKLLPRRLRVKNYETVFDPAKLELSEPQSGRVFRFDRARGVLLINQAVYRKL
ncbi:hypothetical protein KXD93_22550 [Mucilaginibacter sp. BJC16-A38]|uniref:hypothetical protein n=1 Tax=Mucilaginibacter phenanthrenivorans TaxID=1234842 RepID=UPI002156FC8D|nr:hypothetical protein [Mucilaginibacter phenanthrenivorans]MCR8560452.1 hypothetical protein [Mucilaginibacter phenanthrenivorans]